MLYLKTQREHTKPFFVIISTIIWMFSNVFTHIYRVIAVFITVKAPAVLQQKNFNGVYLSHSSEMGTESL